jgi:hypothetical protein
MLICINKYYFQICYFSKNYLILYTGFYGWNGGGRIVHMCMCVCVFSPLNFAFYRDVSVIVGANGCLCYYG